MKKEKLSLCRSFPADVSSLRTINYPSQVLTDSFIFYLVSWFERARAFVILSDMKENQYLMSLLEEFFDSALVCMCTKGAGGFCYWIGKPLFTVFSLKIPS